MTEKTRTPYGQRLSPSGRGVTSDDDAHPPEEQRTEEGGDQPGSQQGQSAQMAVERMGEEEDRYSDERRKDAEVGVRPFVMDEPLYADAAVGERKMAVKQSSCLHVVFVGAWRRLGLVDPKGIDRPGPQVPQHPQVGQAGGNDRRRNNCSKPTCPPAGWDLPVSAVVARQHLVGVIGNGGHRIISPSEQSYRSERRTICSVFKWSM